MAVPVMAEPASTPLPVEAVKAAANVLLRDHQSQYSADHLSWLDFADLARTALAVAVPLLHAGQPGKEQLNHFSEAAESPLTCDSCLDAPATWLAVLGRTNADRTPAPGHVLRLLCGGCAGRTGEIAAAGGRAVTFHPVGATAMQAGGPYPFEPDWTLRPGESVAEILAERQLSMADAAALCGLPAEVIEGVVNGSVTVDERIASHLAALGGSAADWLNYQRNYDADLARGAKDVSTDPREYRALTNAEGTPDHPAGRWEDLVLFLNGMPDSFTGQLLTLAAKADPGNLARLREAYPFEVRAWEAWRNHSPATWGELAALLR